MRGSERRGGSMPPTSGVRRPPSDIGPSSSASWRVQRTLRSSWPTRISRPWPSSTPCCCAVPTAILRASTVCAGRIRSCAGRDSSLLAQSAARSRGRLGLLRGFPCRLRFPATYALDDVERDRDDEDGDEGGGEHAAHHSGAEDATRDGARALGGHERDDTEDEGEAGHQDRAQAETCRVQGGVEDGL